MYDYDRRTAGVIKPPPKVLEDLRSAMYDIICGQVWFIQEQWLKMADISRDNRADALSMIQFCKRYASKPKYYKRPARVKVPVNLNGWSYLDSDEKALALSKLPQITLNVYFKGSMQDPGFWQPRNALLRIVFSVSPPDLSGLKYFLNIVDSVLVHETRHVAQTLMEHAGKGKNLVSPSLQNQDLDSEWALRDIEFQPIVGDAIRNLRDELNQTTPSERRSLVQKYVGEVPSKAFMLGSPPIKKLRKLDPKKWQSAVRDIYKGVSDLL